VAVILNEDVISLLLQVENDYHNAVKTAVDEAMNYADGCKKKQDAYIDGLNRDWHLFETSENNKLDKKLSEDEKNLEAKTAELKTRLKISRENKAELISERLKEEVLALYGNR
jgi:hypothetical protein